MRLTDKIVVTMTCPVGLTEKTHFDDEVRGFGLRVRASGAKSWLCQYAKHGVTKKVTLGAPPLVTVGAARARAREIMAAVRLGGDPAKAKAEAREAAANTLGALIPAFLERQRQRLKPRSVIETTRHLTKHARPLHGQGIKAIDRRAIAQLLEAIERNNGAAASNSVRASLSAMFTWAIRSGFIDANPCAYTNRATENGARERVLSDDEIATIWRALDDDGDNAEDIGNRSNGDQESITGTAADYAALVRLLTLTGARRDEVARLRWSEVDLEAALIRLPGERTKNGRAHDIPLSPQALAILKARQMLDSVQHLRDFVFGTNGHGFVDFSGSRADLDRRLDGAIAERWTLHDLRRTLSTRLHGAPFSVAPHVVEALLGHVSGHRSGVAGTYNRADYLIERRAALARWAGYIDDLLAGRTGNVIPLKAARG